MAGISKVQFTETQIADFLRCPVYYDGIYNHKLVAVEEPTMNKLLMSVARFFFAQLMSGKVPATSVLKKRWDFLCGENQDFVDSKKCIEGISQIMKMFQWARSEELIIAETNLPYTFFAKDERIHLDISGSIDALAMKKDGKPEIRVMDFARKIPDQYVLDMKLKYSMDSYGYKQIYGDSIGVHIHHVYSGKDFFTFRANDDFLRMARTLTSAAYCMHERIYFAHENVFCVGCPMRHFCKGWH